MIALLISFVGAKSSRFGSHRIHAYGFGEALEKAGETVRFSRTPTGDEDVVIFAKGCDLWRRSRFRNSRSLVGVTNPEILHLQDAGSTMMPNFLVVGSLEESDSVAFSKLPRVLVPHIEPNLLQLDAVAKRERLRIVYHGNKEHLLEVSPKALRAIKSLSSEYDFALRLIYDFKKLGKVNLGIEGFVDVEHVQWTEADFMERIQECHIGWAPSVNHLAPHSSESENPEVLATKVKRINNHGRALLMSMLGLPVVAEMTHSHFQLYGDSLGGSLAFSEEGWAEGFRRFLASEETRAFNSVKGFQKASKIHSWNMPIRSFRRTVKQILDQRGVGGP